MIGVTDVGEGRLPKGSAAGETLARVLERAGRWSQADAVRTDAKLDAIIKLLHAQRLDMILNTLTRKAL
jgi:hypothetical protein